MRKTNTPYFSFSNLAFQTPGDPLEGQINLNAAMRKLEAFVLGKGNQDEAMVALAFLEDFNPRLEEFCDDIRITFILDDCTDFELKQRHIRRAYNRIVDRLNGRPLQSWGE